MKEARTYSYEISSTTSFIWNVYRDGLEIVRAGKEYPTHGNAVRDALAVIHRLRREDDAVGALDWGAKTHLPSIA